MDKWVCVGHPAFGAGRWLSKGMHSEAVPYYSVRLVRFDIDAMAVGPERLQLVLWELANQPLCYVIYTRDASVSHF